MENESKVLIENKTFLSKELVPMNSASEKKVQLCKFRVKKEGFLFFN